MRERVKERDSDGEKENETVRQRERERERDSERIATWLFGMLTFSQMISLGLGA